MMSELRVLPADVYDALELSVLAFKGVGQPNVYSNFVMFEDGAAPGCPVCILGHSAHITDTNNAWNDIGEALKKVGIGGCVSDEAVRTINARKRVGQHSRVSWKEYTRELNIVRGD